MNPRLPWIVFLFTCLWAGLAPAQTEAPVEAPRSTITLQQVDGQIAAIEADQTLDAPTREGALELLRKAREEVTRGEALTPQAVEFERLTQEAPGRLAAIQAELAKPPVPPVPDAPPEMTSRQAEAALVQAQADLKATKDSLDEAKALIETRDSRRQEIPAQRALIEQDIAATVESLAALPASTEALALKQARELNLRAHEQASRQDLRRLTAELEKIEANRDLRTAELTRTQRRLRYGEQLVAAWEAVLKERREQEAQAAKQRLAELAHRARQQPQIQQLAESLDTLTSELSGKAGVVPKLQAVTAELKEQQRKQLDVRTRFDNTRRKLAVIGLDQTLGVLLRREYEALPQPSRWRLPGDDRELETSKAQLKAYDYQEELERGSDVGGRLAELLEEIRQNEEAGEENPELSSVALEILEARKDLLEELVEDYRLYIEHLVELEQVERQLTEDTTAYREFIAEQILWVRSLSLESVPSLESVQQALAGVLDPATWSAVVVGVIGGFSKHPIADSLGLLALLLLFGSRQAVRRRIRELGQRAQRYKTDHFALTLETLAWTTFLALRLPFLLWFCGALLKGQSDSPAFLSNTAVGLQKVFVLVYFLEFVRVAAIDRGLMEAHLRWPATGVSSLRRNLRWSLWIVYLHGVLKAAGGIQSSDVRTFALELPMFCVAMVVVAIFTKRVFSPGSPLLESYFLRHQDRILSRTRYLWFSAAVLAPVALLVLALLGYLYTATSLETYVLWTWQLVFFVLLIQAVLMRWLFVARRRITVGQALARRAEREAAAAVEGGEEREAVPALDEDKINIPAVDAQTRKLFQSAAVFALVAGLFALWSPVFPALHVLDRIQVWPKLEVLEQGPAGLLDPVPVGGEVAQVQPAAPPAGTAQQPALIPGQPPEPIAESTGSEATPPPPSSNVTLLDVLLALLVVFGTMVAASNVPGLLEILLLSRLPIVGGVRYAISRIVSYAIYVIGFTFAFGALGIGWGEVQWLAAALTFGLAFGLQEIFANFISGLIILFERPIRVGDVVTIGDVEGQVTRIRMRATTVTDWDRREMLVPNREFITNSLINWTLSDATSRIKLDVGIAYGSDTKLAHRLLLESAAETTVVLKEPKPSVVFNLFGDNSLNFCLRCFIPNREVWPEAINDLHMRIDQKFRTAGLEIAFPQRDLHLRSVPKGFFQKDS